MDYYEHLFVGEKAKERRYGILQGLREGRLQPEVYVIMPPLNGNNVLEIVPSALIFEPPYQGREILVMGIAVTYWEALVVAGQIVDELYRRTGGFCLREMIEGDAGS